MTITYSLPVAKLLTLGEPGYSSKWRDYIALGIKSEHVPDLIRMAQDEELRWANSGSKEVWANLHAWRALGQLRTEAAIEPLIGLLHWIDDEDDEWAQGDLPIVFGMMGAGAIPALSKFLAEPSNGEWARVSAAESLEKIAKQHPDSRNECARILARQLEQYASQEETVNAFLISGLLDFKAREYAPIMERAFQANKVDLTVQGDWEDVQIELGLLKERKTPRRNYILESMMGSEDLPDAIEAPRDEAVNSAIWNLEMDGILKPKSERQKKKK